MHQKHLEAGLRPDPLGSSLQRSSGAIGPYLKGIRVATRKWEVILKDRGSEQQGRSDGGGYRYLCPPKLAQVNFLWGKMTSERLFNSFVHPPKQISGYAPGEQGKEGRNRRGGEKERREMREGGK